MGWLSSVRKLRHPFPLVKNPLPSSPARLATPKPRPAQDEPLDAAGTAVAFEALTAEVNAHEAGAGRPPKSADEVAMGFVRVANEAMCRPIRALTQVGAGDLVLRGCGTCLGAGTPSALRVEAPRTPQTLCSR